MIVVSLSDKKMVRDAYDRFYFKRGMDPVQVPTTHLLSTNFNDKPFRVSQKHPTPRRG